MVKGARRIGKSTIVEEFAQKEYKSYILIDFSKAGKDIRDLFNDMSDINFFFLMLKTRFDKKLYERESVIIFDEVQLCPQARQAIKHLVKDGRYDYIETGSLLSIKKNIKGIVIPSEETRIEMHPMDFEEFQWALNDEVSLPFMQELFQKKRPAGNAVHRKLMRNFRLYMLIGGMPQALNAYIENNDFSTVDAVKREILELYEDDFRRIDPTGKASLLFNNIPAMLSANVSRYQISSVLGNNHLASIEEILMDMKDSMTVSMAYHANDPSVGFSLHKAISKFKLFLEDTGLFVTLAFKDKAFTENIIYQKLLNDSLNANLGYVYENAIAQILRSKGAELFYYSFPKPNSTKRYEIDFLLSRGNKICPIEVKSSGYNVHASLDAFRQKFSDRIKTCYLLHTKDTQADGAIQMLPVYFAQFL